MEENKNAKITEFKGTAQTQQEPAKCAFSAWRCPYHKQRPDPYRIVERNSWFKVCLLCLLACIAESV